MGVATLVTRVVAAAGFALLVIWTMRWPDLLRALSAMRMPDVVVATLAMTQKQILTLLRTVEQIHLARESRTLALGTTRENRDWVTERMAFVVRKSLKTADDVYDAMLSRGFTGAMPSLVRLRMRPARLGVGGGERRALLAVVAPTGWSGRERDRLRPERRRPRVPRRRHGSGDHRPDASAAASTSPSSAPTAPASPRC